MENFKILVVEDDVFIREMVELAFLREGYHVFTAADGREGLRQFYEVQPDLVIMDIMMPHTDGWELFRQIRKLADTPVIMLTAVSHEDAIVRGLDMGAVDYVTKPFSVKVLIARARAALRPVTNPSESPAAVIYEDDHLYIDLEYRRIRVDGAQIHLTNIEFKLLSYLIENKGRVLTFNQILDEVWGSGYTGSAEYVHVYISRLRKKLEKDPKNPVYIINVPQVGYRFDLTELYPFE